MRDKRYETSDTWIREQVGVILLKTGFDMGELAKYLGISKTALYQKRSDPDKFRLGEIRLLEDFARKKGFSVFEGPLTEAKEREKEHSPYRIF